MISLDSAQGRVGRFISTLGQLRLKALKLDADVYHFHDAELIPLGIELKLRGKRVVYDVHEDLPKQVLEKPWIPRLLRPVVGILARLLEGVGALFFDAIVTATPDIQRRFPRHKSLTVSNYPDETEYGNTTNTIAYLERPYHVVYAGGIYETRGVEQMIDAVRIIHERSGATLLLAGRFGDQRSEKLAASAVAEGFVRFEGWLDREQIVDLYEQCRAGLIVLHPEPRFLTSYPIKMFEYMAAGLPVIASDFPLWREIILGAQCGVVVDPLDSKAIASAIEWMIEHPVEAEEMGQRGRLAVEQRYNWSKEWKKLDALYHRLLA